jgi:hypothetical protein
MRTTHEHQSNKMQESVSLSYHVSQDVAMAMAMAMAMEMEIDKSGRKVKEKVPRQSKQRWECH